MNPRYDYDNDDGDRPFVRPNRERNVTDDDVASRMGFLGPVSYAITDMMYMNSLKKAFLLLFCLLIPLMLIINPIRYDVIQQPTNQPINHPINQPLNQNGRKEDTNFFNPTRYEDVYQPPKEIPSNTPNNPSDNLQYTTGSGSKVELVNVVTDYHLKDESRISNVEIIDDEVRIPPHSFDFFDGKRYPVDDGSVPLRERSKDLFERRRERIRDDLYDDKERSKHTKENFDDEYNPRDNAYTYNQDRVRVNNVHRTRDNYYENRNRGDDNIYERPRYSVEEPTDSYDRDRDYVRDGTDRLKEKYYEDKEKVKRFAEETKDRAKESFYNTRDYIHGKKENVKNFVEDKKDRAEDFIHDKKERVKDIYNEDKEKVKRFAEETKDRAKESFYNARDYIHDKKEKVKNFVEDKKDRVEDFFHNKKENVKAFVEDKKDRVEDFIHDKKERVKDIYNEDKEKVKRFAEETKDRAKESFYNTRDYIHDKKENVKAFVEDKKDRAKDFINDKKERTKEIYQKGKEKVKDYIEEKKENFFHKNNPERDYDVPKDTFMGEYDPNYFNKKSSADEGSIEVNKVDMKVEEEIREPTFGSRSHKDTFPSNEKFVFNVNIPNTNQDIKIKERVNTMNNAYDKGIDKTSASIVYKQPLTSPTYSRFPLKNYFANIFSFAFGRKEMMNYPINALSDNMQPGHCYSFEGQKGNLTVDLKHPSKVIAVSIDHPHSTTHLKSSPKKFSIFSFNAQTLDQLYLYSGSGVEIGKDFVFDLKSVGPQIFPTAHRDSRFLQFRFHENHGDNEYTCVYRINVYVDNEKV